MTTQIEQVKSFQEKISDKIKESIGDLITDEDLKPLVEKSIEKLLTETRKIKRTGGYSSYEDAPPLLIEIIEPLIKSQIQTQVTKYVIDHPDIFDNIFNDIIKTGFIKVMINHIDYKLQSPLMDFQQQVQNIFLKNNIQP